MGSETISREEVRAVFIAAERPLTTSEVVRVCWDSGMWAANYGDVYRRLRQMDRRGEVRRVKAHNRVLWWLS